jgi:hypothetical protein
LKTTKERGREKTLHTEEPLTSVLAFEPTAGDDTSVAVDATDALLANGSRPFPTPPPMVIVGAVSTLFAPGLVSLPPPPPPAAPPSPVPALNLAGGSAYDDDEPEGMLLDEEDWSREEDVEGIIISSCSRF